MDKRRREIAQLAVLGMLLAMVCAPAATAASVDDLLFELQLVPKDGQAPAPFTLPTLDGKPVSLADHRGKVVLLYFWATW